MKFEKLYPGMFLYGLLALTACQIQRDENGAKAQEAGSAVDEPASQEVYREGEVWPIDTSGHFVMGHLERADGTDLRGVQVQHADRPGLYLRKDTYSRFQP